MFRSTLLQAPVNRFFFILLVFIALFSGAAHGSQVVVLPVQGIIGPATSDYLGRGFTEATESGASLIIIELDTPGGLDPSMRAIVQDILRSPVPIATFVSPGGARAASAGTFILYASHIAAMTPASNLGAASPVSVGIGGAQDPDRQGRAGRTSKSDQTSDETQSTDDTATNDSDRAAQQPADDVMTSKIKNDATAYIRSLAQLRDRNVEFAEQAVLDAKSLSAHDALEQGVIEYIANDVMALLQQLHGVEVQIDDGTRVTLNTHDAAVQYIEPGWRTKVLSILTNPQLALVLMMVGIYGLFFELTSPGFALPGVAGMICLLLGLYAFHMLPVNWTGVALLFLGTILMIAEVFLSSFGAIGIGGVIAFVLGGLFLTDTGIPGYDLSLPFLLGLAVASALLLMLAGTLVARSSKQVVVTGNEAMLGLEGRVTQWEMGHQYAQVRGEQWRITSDEPLTTGDRIRVTSVQGLTLHVARIGTSSVDATPTKG